MKFMHDDRTFSDPRNTERDRIWKELKKENIRLKRMVADLMLDKDMLTELAKGNF